MYCQRGFCSRQVIHSQTFAEHFDAGPSPASPSLNGGRGMYQDDHGSAPAQVPFQATGALLRLYRSDLSRLAGMPTADAPVVAVTKWVVSALPSCCLWSYAASGCWVGSACAKEVQCCSRARGGAGLHVKGVGTAGVGLAAPSPVGRDQEPARPRLWLLAAEGGSGGTLIPRGDAGIGKTWLISEITALATPQNVAVRVSEVGQFDQTRRFAAIAGALRISPRSAAPALAGLTRRLGPGHGFSGSYGCLAR